MDAALGRVRFEWSILVARVTEDRSELVGPELLWSETVSALHALAWRGELELEAAKDAVELVETAPISVRHPRDLRRRAWSVADRMGWTRTYDAEYCALAEILRCELVTTDGRLRAAGQRLGYVFTLTEMAARL